MKDLQREGELALRQEAAAALEAMFGASRQQLGTAHVPTGLPEQQGADKKLGNKTVACLDQTVAI